MTDGEYRECIEYALHGDRPYALLSSKNMLTPEQVQAFWNSSLSGEPASVVNVTPRMVHIRAKN